MIMAWIAVLAALLAVGLLFAVRRSLKEVSDDLSRVKYGLDSVVRELEALSRTLRDSRDGARQGPPVSGGADDGMTLPETGSAPLAATARPAAGKMPPPLPPPEPPGAAETSAGCSDESGPMTSAVPSVLAPMAGILRRIWQWILVGQECRAPGVSMEYALATTWLVRVGVIVIVTCVGFFLKLSIDRGLVGPWGRVAIAVLAGMALLLGGLKLCARHPWAVLGHGLVGGALATFYFALYAAGPLYHVLDPALVFPLMILVTVAAGVLALCLDSMLVAILGILGGFCTPVMLRTGEPHFFSLYLYMLLLNFGILGLSHIKQWRLLNVLAWGVTYLLFFGSLQQYDRSVFPVAMTFLCLFFGVHSLGVYAYNIRQGLRSTGIEIGQILSNGLLFAAGGYYLIEQAVGRPYPALLTAALAACYIVQTALFMRRALLDRALWLTLISLAGLFAVLTVPLAMEKESITTSWALMALLFVWLGIRLESHFVRQLGYVLFVLTAARLVAWDTPLTYRLEAADHAAAAEYWGGLARRLWTFGLSLGAMAAAYALEHQRASCRATFGSCPADPSEERIPAAAGKRLFFWAGLAIGFLFLQLEFRPLFAFFPLWRPAAQTALGCGLALFLWVRYGRTGEGSLFWVGCACMGAVTLKLLLWDLNGWHLTHPGIYAGPYTGRTVLARALDYGAVLLAFVLGWRILVGPGAARTMAAVFGYGSLGLLFLCLTLELNSLLYWTLREFQTGGLSTFWTVFAFGLLGVGLWKSVAPLRYAGLGLCALAVAKVFLVDLAHMPVVYRVVAFLGVGIFLLLGAGAYMYASPHAGRPATDEARGPNDEGMSAK